MSREFSVAIDGPAGSGKSSVAKELSKKFHLVHVDSGAFYRAVAFYFVRNSIHLDSQQQVQQALKDIRFAFQNGKLFLNENIVGDEIRTRQISQMASTVSVIQSVREYVTEEIRKLTKDSRVIMDGRDIGTVVLPEATIKIYITASVEERAKRRQKELFEKGIQTSIEVLKEEIKERDERDTSREISPLKPAQDALLVDTTLCSFEEVVSNISKIIQQKLEEM